MGEFSGPSHFLLRGEKGVPTWKYFRTAFDGSPSRNSFPEFLIDDDDDGHEMLFARDFRVKVGPKITLQILTGERGEVCQTMRYIFIDFFSIHF